MKNFLLEVLTPFILISPLLVDGRRGYGGGHLFISTDNDASTIWIVLGIAFSVGVSVCCCLCRLQKKEKKSRSDGESCRECEEDAKNQRQISEDSILKFKVKTKAADMSLSIQATTRASLKSGLITGACKDVGLQIGLSLAKRLPAGSSLYLTTKKEDDIPRLTEELAANHEADVVEKIKFEHLDFHDKGSLIKLYQKIKSEAITLDILINNAQKYHLPSIMDDKKFSSQCEDTMVVNYHGVKKMCKTFSPMMSQGGRIVNCSSHLGHLSNLDGREPEATLLRDKFSDKNLSEEELDRIIKQFENLTAEEGGKWWHEGWPSCPYTVSKIAINAYTRILQSRLDSYHQQKDLVVNAVHHGCMHRHMNSSAGFSPAQAGDLVAGLALLPDNTNIRGKIIWRDFMTFDNWQYGGLDDDSKQSKAFVATYDMENEADQIHDMNTGFCLSG